MNVFACALQLGYFVGVSQCFHFANGTCMVLNKCECTLLVSTSVLCSTEASLFVSVCFVYPLFCFRHRIHTTIGVSFCVLTKVRLYNGTYRLSESNMCRVVMQSDCSFVVLSSATSADLPCVLPAFHCVLSFSYCSVFTEGFFFGIVCTFRMLSTSTRADICPCPKLWSCTIRGTCYAFWRPSMQPTTCMVTSSLTTL